MIVAMVALLVCCGCRRGHGEWKNALNELRESEEINEPPYTVRDSQGVHEVEYGKGNGTNDKGAERISGAENVLGAFTPAEEARRAKMIPKGGIKKGPRHHDRIYVRPIGNLKQLFNDSNYIQYAYAEKLGITPITNLNEAFNTRRPIIKMESCEDFEIDSLKYSLPYLVPEASRLLHKIGKNFKDSLAARGADGYRIKVTSLLRTPHTVKRLRRVNVNATDSSTHQFGTTFDISWVNFHCLDTTRTIHEGDLKNLLGEVLQDLRSRGECLVIFERKTGCYHVTATK